MPNFSQKGALDFLTFNQVILSQRHGVRAVSAFSEVGAEALNRVA